MSGASAGDIFASAARSDRAKGRAALRARLEERRAEMEQALLARVYGVADPSEVEDLAYREGLRAATSAAVDFGLTTIESSQDHLPLVPPALLAQARLAARNGIGLDTVLRRYTAGHALLVDFLAEEVERNGVLSTTELRRLLAVISAAIDRLLAAVSEEHASELERRVGFSKERRLVERVERLLGGEPVDAASLGYDFDAWHTAVVLVGEDDFGGLQALAEALDGRLLRVRPKSHQTWAWLGRRSRVESCEIAGMVEDGWQSGVNLGLGEPGWGLAGWRLTHRQAKAVLPVTGDRTGRVTRYAEVGLIASVSRDEVLVESLRQIYLDPLNDRSGRAAALSETLRAYLTTGRNITSAAARLEVNRQTVRKRLRMAEERLVRSLDECAVELELALRLDDVRPQST